MKRILLALAVLVGFSTTGAMALCPANFGQMKDNAGSTFNMGLASDPNGNCASYNVINIPSAAVASGAFASGAFASGALASGAMVDITNLSAPLNAGAGSATKAMVIGGQFLSTQPTMANTQQAGVLFSSRGELLVAPGASGFTVTSNVGTGTRAVSIASGQVVSGALASGAVVDITNEQAPIAPAAATATKSVVIGGQFNTTQPTFTTGQQGSGQLSARGELLVATGVSGFNVTNAGTFATQASQAGNWSVRLQDGAGNVINSTGNALNVNIASGNITGFSTSANQTTAIGILNGVTQTTAHGCSVAGYGVVGCLGQIDDDIKGPMPVMVNGTAQGTTGLTPGTAQTGTIYGFNTDLSSVKGTATDVNTGTATAGTQRVVLASNQPTINVATIANATGGATTGSTASGIAAASNNSTNIKASAGTVYGIQTGNINATTAYWLKLYDKATAPTCGTDVPVKRILIPPNNSGNNAMFPVGVKFNNGIGFCIVTNIPDTDNTAVPAATVAYNIDWN